jgi:apolipoprotein N-acyltransferase
LIVYFASCGRHGPVDYPELVAKQTRAPQPQETSNRSERILLYMVGAVIGLSLLSFAVTIVGWLTLHELPATGIWPIALVLPEVGLPIGLLLIIALIVVVWRRKAHENRDS